MRIPELFSHGVNQDGLHIDCLIEPDQAVDSYLMQKRIDGAARRLDAYRDPEFYSKRKAAGNQMSLWGDEDEAKHPRNDAGEFKKKDESSVILAQSDSVKPSVAETKPDMKEEKKMSIKTGKEKDQKARYRICVEGKGSKAVKATADTMEDVAKYLEEKGEWVFVAQGIMGLEIDHEPVAIHDRDVDHRPGDGDRVMGWGQSPDSRKYTRKANGVNPRMDD